MDSTGNDDGSKRGWHIGTFFANLFGLSPGGRSIVPAGGTTSAAWDKGQVPPALRMVQNARATTDPIGQSRLQMSRNKIAMWKGQHRPLVEALLRTNFHPENYARMRLMPHSATNVLQRVARELSVLYENPAKRKLLENKKQVQTEGDIADPNATPVDNTDAAPLEDVAKDTGAGTGAPNTEQQANGAAPAEVPAAGTGDVDLDALAAELGLTGASDAEETPFDLVMKAFDWDVLLDTVEKYASFLPAVWVRPMVRYVYQVDANGALLRDTKGDPIPDPATGKLVFIIYTPDCADVVPDPEDKTQALAFWYAQDELREDGTIARVFHFYTASSYFKFDERWNFMRQEKNQLGRLPVTVFRLDMPVNDYFMDGTGNDLYEGTLEACVLKTIQNARARDGGFKQLAIQGDPEKVPADQVMGGPTPIYLGEEMQATVLDFQPMLDQFTQLCRERTLELVGKYGITPANYKMDAMPQSGFAKKLDHDLILRENKRRRKFFAKGEQDLWNLTATTCNLWPLPKVGHLDPDAELETDFAEPSFDEDPNKQVRTDAQRLKLGLTNIVELLRKENPDLSDVELLRMAYKNQRINEHFMTSDQMRLVDLLASGAMVGASLGSGSPAAAPPQGPEAGGGQGGKPPFGNSAEE